MPSLTKPLLVIVVTLITACAPEDPFSAPSIELTKRLEKFERTENPAPIHEWLAKYHGEASGMALYHTFIEWGNENVRLMNMLLEDWPRETKAKVFENLNWNSKDASMPMRFTVPKDQ